MEALIASLITWSLWGGFNFFYYYIQFYEEIVKLNLWWKITFVIFCGPLAWLFIIFQLILEVYRQFRS